MIALQSDVRVYLACGYTDMRKGMQGLAMLVQRVLAEDPFNSALYAFRGRRGNLLKLVWHDGIGLCMLTKRLERGHFIWPMTSTGAIALSAGQLSTLLVGCEWRATARNLRTPNWQADRNRQDHAGSHWPRREDVRHYHCAMQIDPRGSA